MSEKQNRGMTDLAQYDAMTTEELEEILRLDAEMPEGQESDTDTILYIMEVLAKRDSSHTEKSALEAYESFKCNYGPDAESEKTPDAAFVKHKKPCWVRSLIAAAAVLVILIAGTVTADALGFDLWKTVVRWTQETFHFGQQGNPDGDESLSYDSLQAALEKGNAPAWLAPTQFPEGFQLDEVKVEQTPKRKTYAAKYIKGEQVLKVSIRDHLDENPFYAEQSEGLVEEYQSSGITYYLFDNYGQVSAAWAVDSYECYISGDITIEDLKLILNSIKKG